MSMTPIIQHKKSERKNVDIMEKEPDVKEDRIAGIDMRIVERRIFEQSGGLHEECKSRQKKM